MEIHLNEAKQILSATTVFNILSNVLKAEDPLDGAKEHFWVLGLNTRNYIEYLELVHLGTANYCTYHPREIFRRACIKGIISVIIVHNHPSGSPAPSQEDKRATEKLAAAGEIIGIKVLDHVIIGKDTFYSFGDEGLL